MQVWTDVDGRRRLRLRYQLALVAPVLIGPTTALLEVGRVAWPWFVAAAATLAGVVGVVPHTRYGRVLDDRLEATSGPSRLLGVAAFAVAAWLFVQYYEPGPVVFNSFLAGAMEAIAGVSVVEHYVT